MVAQDRKAPRIRQSDAAKLRILRRCLVDIRFLMALRSARLEAHAHIEISVERRKAQSLINQMIQTGVVEKMDQVMVIRPEFTFVTEFELEESRSAYLAKLEERVAQMDCHDVERRVIVGQLNLIAALVTEVAFWDKILPDALNFGPSAVKRRASSGEPVAANSNDYLWQKEQREEELRNPDAVLLAAQRQVQESKTIIKRITRRGQAARRAARKKGTRSAARAMEATAD